LYTAADAWRLGKLGASSQSSCCDCIAWFRDADNGLWPLVSRRTKAVHRSAEAIDQGTYGIHCHSHRYDPRITRRIGVRAEYSPWNCLEGTRRPTGNFLLATDSFWCPSPYRPCCDDLDHRQASAHTGGDGITLSCCR